MPLILEKNTALSIGDRVHALMYDPLIETEAKELAKYAFKDGRSAEVVEQNAIPSLAIQYAVLEHVAALGAIYEPTPIGQFHYDGILNGIKVDVKVRMDGARWQQTRWESWKVEQTGDRVLYLCIDLLLNGTYIFKGCIWGDELEPSSYGCPYVATHKLQDLNLI